MFVGHFGAALAASAVRGAPKMPVLILASQLTDFAFFALALTGAERFRVVEGITDLNHLDLYHLPYTHSLLGTLVWAAAFGMLVALFTSRRAAGAVAAAVVSSHWLLDLITHRPDLTLAGAPPYLGFGLWNLPSLEIPIELGLLAGGAWLYSRAEPSRTAAGRYAMWAFVGLLVAVQILNWFGEPVQDTGFVAMQGLAAFAVIVVLSIAVGYFRRRA